MTMVAGDRTDLTRSYHEYFTLLSLVVIGSRRSVRSRRERAARVGVNGYRVAGHIRLFHVTKRTALRTV